jgi:hypothetical protein
VTISECAPETFADNSATSSQCQSHQSLVLHSKRSCSRMFVTPSLHDQVSVTEFQTPEVKSGSQNLPDVFHSPVANCLLKYSPKGIKALSGNSCQRCICRDARAPASNGNDQPILCGLQKSTGKKPTNRVLPSNYGFETSNSLSQVNNGLVIHSEFLCSGSS